MIQIANTIFSLDCFDFVLWWFLQWLLLQSQFVRLFIPGFPFPPWLSFPPPPPLLPNFSLLYGSPSLFWEQKQNHPLLCFRNGRFIWHKEVSFFWLTNKGPGMNDRGRETSVFKAGALEAKIAVTGKRLTHQEIPFVLLINLTPRLGTQILPQF